MDLSAKMPAQMDSTLPASMPSTRKSDAPATGGGSNDAPVTEIVRDIKRDSRLGWECVNDQKGDWQNADAKSGKGGVTWESSDDIESAEGGLPQRDPDNDGDLN